MITSKDGYKSILLQNICLMRFSMNIMIIEIKLTKEIIIHEYMKIATFLLLNIDNDRK